MITNLRYNYKTQLIKIKNFNTTDLIFEKLYCAFFANKEYKFPFSNGFKIEKSDKRYFFDQEEVNRIILYNNKLFESFNFYSKEYLYLFDLKPEYQYILYHNAELSNKFRKSYLDIETDDDLDPDNAKSPILIISILIDGKIKLYNILEYDSEYSMLKDFFSWITNTAFPDVVLGWNVVGYDLKYLINRAKRLNVPYDKTKFSMIEFINMADIVLKKFGYSVLRETGSMSLDSMSKHFLGQGKKNIPTTFGIHFKKNPEDAIEYNLNDTVILECLDAKLQLFEFLLRIQEISGVLLRDVFYNSSIIDTMILKKYDKFVFPSKKMSVEDINYEGGFVFSPPKGVFNNVAIIDFSAMYPSIILTFNISPDTKDNVNYDYQIDGVGFKAKPDGIFKETIKFLFDERLQLKNKLKLLDKNSIEYKNLDTLQSAYKTILNSFYGVCAFKDFRFFDIDLAKSITSIGRKLINEIKVMIEENVLGQVVYGDTDSIFIQFDEDIDKILEIINEVFIPEILREYKITENYLNVELHDVYSKIVLFGKKKKYIARSQSGAFNIKGFDTERYDVPMKFKKIMREIIEKLFDLEEININEYRKKIENLDLIDYSFLKRFNKKKDMYKVIPQHLKALNWSEKYLPLSINTKKASMVRLIFVNLDENVEYDATDAIVIDENVINLPNGVHIDHEKYFHFFLIQKMKDLYDIFGVEYDGK